MGGRDEDRGYAVLDGSWEGGRGSWGGGGGTGISVTQFVFPDFVDIKMISVIAAIIIIIIVLKFYCNCHKCSCYC